MGEARGVSRASLFEVRVVNPRIHYTGRSAIDIRHHDLPSYRDVSEYAQDAGNISRDFGICCIYPPLVSDYVEWTPYTSLHYVVFNLRLMMN